MSWWHGYPPTESSQLITERLDSVDDEILELYKRSNILLKTLEKLEQSMEILNENQKKLEKAHDNLAETVKQMTH